MRIRAQQALDTAEKDLERLRGECAMRLQHLIEAQAAVLPVCDGEEKRGMTVDSLVVARTEVDCRRERYQKACEAVAYGEHEVRMCRVTLQKADDLWQARDNEVKALEKHKERLLSQHLRDVARKEDERLDEIGSNLSSFRGSGA